MQSNEEVLKEALQTAIRLLKRAENEIQRLRLANALLTPRKPGRPKKAGGLKKNQESSGRGLPGRRAKWAGDDLPAFIEIMPLVRKQSAYREWLAQHDRQDSKTSALTYMLAILYQGRGIRSSRAFHDVATLRRRLSEWEKKRAQ